MSSNSLRASVAFSFKAETFVLDSRIDLDPCLADSEKPPNFHLLLARAAGIDPYSYLYEALESHDIEFSEPTGVAAQSCHEGGFDWFRFVRDAREPAELQVVSAIAEQMLARMNPDQCPDIKAALQSTFLPALLEAYRAGKAHGAA